MVAVRSKGAVNEIELFQDVRSFGSSEGCWRTFNFEMSHRAPTVVRLPVHLEDQQTCQFVEGTEAATCRLDGRLSYRRAGKRHGVRACVSE